ncbi:MAG: VOC family protein [Caldilinea sp. CFX5]|nr:VOC family protein [Caldilinea sp. CFX5]
MLKCVEHIAIAARDPAPLAHWYGETLGFQTIVAAPESRVYFVALPSGGIIEIIPIDPQAPGEAITHRAGFHHVALAVDDFAQAHALLTVRGVPFCGPAYRSADGSVQFDFFLDPEGNRLQLVQRARPLGS